MANIGFIGLGHMGLPMAINLIKAGHQVHGYDLQASAQNAFLQAGGQIAPSIKAIAQNNAILITMLQTGQQVKNVCFGEEGLYQQARPQTLHIDCSTIDVPTAIELQQYAHSLGLEAVDAPVSGGVSGASAATLTFMLGGTSDACAKAHSILQSMGKQIILTGAGGSGQAAKICNNMILGISMVAVSEAF
ncbi:MAG TPA: NAD(P)-dependent oxidoreductase, partial [Legionellaceae bacterium]|nr:NAD(P)-dependent oxidoreductase [Legionellaceae bacterium]